ncbi:MAG TPA: 23S rRNA (uracil(1939)-C(5))-methyltransferase RlmD [Elusimicrobia bacterium]|nr:MAG: 23S rRNA (uracil-5-)-methyltransferase RumA [Elusimicrobia bacterium GWA2_66_18]OGR70896.1 MAG: 23S rRNA (uracil-5-)-methyltransferase RumA [Elusimicrobia bacterium GWC2_65_9]HAZ08846.1 23S rRNA (uracil(1939)-C(5))-methyltransferase RlmD [Elusimicrobiota bacterium]
MSATSSSPTESSIRCRHFGACGGCSLQDRPYEDQLAFKKGKVAAALAGIEGLPPLGILGAPRIWNYRNKMEFSFGDVYPPAAGQWLKLGMKPKGRWYEILDLSECHLPSPEAAPLLAAVRAWAEDEKVPPYNSHKKEGQLRHLVLREAKNRPERMVLLVTTAGEIPRRSFVDAVLGAYPATTILIGRNAKVSDTAVSDTLEVLTGPGHVTETLRFSDGALDYRISPQSFFQTNTTGTEALYGLLRAWTRELQAKSVLDLYCGGGGIALSLAGAARKVVGVESNRSAVQDATVNAALNGLENCEFYGGTVEFLLPALLDMQPEAAVIDPPRAGLHAGALRALIETPPPALFYVSCNPEALARDLKVLSPRYRVERLVAVDLFPHTDHVETVAWLKNQARHAPDARFP